METPMLAHPKYAVESGGSLLCHGNPNEGLRYHFCWTDFDASQAVLLDTRREAEEVMSEFKSELRSRCKLRGVKYKPVKMCVVRIQMSWWKTVGQNMKGE